MKNFKETRFYEIENTVSPMWMNKDNLQLCINSCCKNGGARVVADITDQITQLKQFAKEAMRVVEFYGDDTKWESQQYPSYGRRLATIHDKDVGEVIAKTGHRWSIGGKTARELKNSDIYKQVKSTLD